MQTNKQTKEQTTNKYRIFLGQQGVEIYTQLCMYGKVNE